MSRKIKIIGDIDSDNYEVFSEKMDELEAASKKPIHIELCSGGGETYVGLAYYGRIKSSPCPVHITAYGQVMSAATIILAAGTVRIMQGDAWFMVHDDALSVKEPTRIRAVVEFSHHETVERQWAEILSRHSKVDKDIWREWSKDTRYLNAADCLEIGIIDKIA